MQKIFSVLFGNQKMKQVEEVEETVHLFFCRHVLVSADGVCNLAEDDGSIEKGGQEIVEQGKWVLLGNNEGGRLEERLPVNGTLFESTIGGKSLAGKVIRVVRVDTG